MIPIWRTCRCGAYLPVYSDETFPEHNVGDAPLWWGDDRCEMSGKPSRRRQGRAEGTWWMKYTLKRSA